MITLEDDQYKMVMDVSEAFGVSASKVIRDMVEASKPALGAALELKEQSKGLERKASVKLVGAMRDAEDGVAALL